MAIAYLNKAMELEPKLEEKMKKEELFITIKTYIVIDKEKKNENKKELKEQEKKIKKHLEETFEKVKKLNSRTEMFKERFKLDKIKEERTK